MHLTVEEALELIEGQARESQITFWTSHMTGCDGCREQLKSWKQLHITLAGKHLENAPQNLLRAAEAIFEKAPERTRIPILRKVIATLVFDSFTQPALAGARGAAAARQIVLRAEEYDIHLRIWGGRDDRRMTGQVLARGAASFVEGANLHLMRDGMHFESTSLDNLGEFEFPGLPDGKLSLQMDLPNLTIVGGLKFS